VLSASQGRPPFLFIAPRAKLAVAPSLGKTRGHQTLTGSHRTLNTQRPVLRRQPHVTSRLNSTVAANGYFTRAPAQHHRMLYCVTPDACSAHRTCAQRAPQTRTVTGRTLSVRCSPDSCAEKVAKPPAHQTLSTGLSPVRPVHSTTPDTTPDAKGHHPVPPRRASGERNTPATSPKILTDAIENIHLIFSKAPNPAELGERNPHPSQP